MSQQSPIPIPKRRAIWTGSAGSAAPNIPTSSESRASPMHRPSRAGSTCCAQISQQRNSKRMGLRAGALARGIGTSTKALGGGPITAPAPVALGPSRRQRRTRLALRPCASATVATEAPGCWQARTSWHLSSAVWLCRVRFVGVLCIVSTCLLCGHDPLGLALHSQDGFTGRILLT